MAKYTIPLHTIATEFSLETITVPKEYESILITTPELNRPGLALGGYYERFDKTRIQIIGSAETYFLRSLTEEDRNARLYALVSALPVAISKARRTEAMSSGRMVNPARSMPFSPASRVISARSCASLSASKRLTEF